MCYIEILIHLKPVQIELCSCLEGNSEDGGSRLLITTVARNPSQDGGKPLPWNTSIVTTYQTTRFSISEAHAFEISWQV